MKKEKQFNLLNVFAIAMLSKIAINGIVPNDEPSSEIISEKEYDVPLTVVLNGGNSNGGNPGVICPDNLNGVLPSCVRQ